MSHMPSSVAKIAVLFSKLPPPAYPVLTPMPRLTKRFIDTETPRATGDTVIWDDEIPGFGLRVKPGGARSFLIQYRNVNGRSRRLTLGRYGVITPDDARTRARLALADVARGHDPAETKNAERRALTVAQLCRDYLDKAGEGLII